MTRARGKAVVVTGGAVGLAGAMDLAESGAGVMVVDLDDGQGEESAERIRAAGGHGNFVRANLPQAPGRRTRHSGNVTAASWRNDRRTSHTAFKHR